MENFVVTFCKIEIFEPLCKIFINTAPKKNPHQTAKFVPQTTKRHDDKSIRKILSANIPFEVKLINMRFRRRLRRGHSSTLVKVHRRDCRLI